jgi:hypothetical protein
MGTRRLHIRALANFSIGPVLRSYIAEAGLLTIIGNLSFGESEAFTDMVAKRYAIASMANFASDEQYRKAYFSPVHIESLLAIVSRSQGQDHIRIDAVQTLANLAISRMCS